MVPVIESTAELLEEFAMLQSRLAEAEDTLRAIRSGEVDALIVSTRQGNQVFTLQSADQPYRLLVEQMLQGAVTIANDGTILYCNPCFAQTVGYPSSSLISHKIDQLIVSEEREPFQAFLGTVSSQAGIHQEFHCRNQINQVIPVYVSANLLPLGQTQVVCLIFTDLRPQKLIERHAIELAAEKQRTRLLADFVRDTSHDLKTPITVIVSGLYLIQHTQDEDRRREKIQVVERHVLYLNRVLEQLQQMAVLDSTTELSLQTGNINAVITDAIWSVEKMAIEQSITISTELKSDIPPIDLDPELLLCALSELIENAIRFTLPGGEIHIRSAVMNDSQLMIEVVDHGFGISAENLRHVFDRFFKADESRKMTGGAGLGLSMTKRIVELHHGSIEVVSVPGEVTTFRVLLPAIFSEAQAKVIS